MRLYIFWYPERGSNPHVLIGQRILSPLRLPIPPSGRTIVFFSVDRLGEYCRSYIYQITQIVVELFA